MTRKMHVWFVEETEGVLVEPRGLPVNDTEMGIIETACCGGNWIDEGELVDG